MRRPHPRRVRLVHPRAREADPRTGLRRLIVRGLVVLALDWVGLMVLGALLSDFSVDGPAGALVTAVIAAVLNALIWPTLSRLALPLSVVTLGGAAIVLNGGLVAIAAAISPGQRSAAGSRASSWPWASPSSPPRPRRCWPSTTTRRGSATSSAARRGAPRASIATDVPGCSSWRSTGSRTRSLRRAIRDGDMPTVAALAARRHAPPRPLGDRLVLADRRLPGGLLHGNNDDMPAFRWWEKDTQRAIVTNHVRTPPSSSAASRTAAGCSTRTARAARTSSPATRRTRC